MALGPGVRLGPYEIQSPLGAGGMGEVFRARDTRLDRTVAIKVLSPTLAADPQFRERFEREARAVSALDHPNICALYDVGRESIGVDPMPVDFLVMQFVDGETLSKRLERGPLKIHEVIRLAMEIASALDKAHRSGIVHRDLKPGNVMLTATGAKLLDFGLAKIAAPVAAAPMVSAVPTVELTAEGTILGTFQYMAPEQLEGGDAGPRTDLFAFGAVIYEAATGRKAFEGKSRVSLIGAILRDDPPPISSVRHPSRPGSTASGATGWSGVVDVDALSAGLDRVVHRCLAKNPDDRWQTAADLLEALRWVAEGRAAAETMSPARGRRTVLERAAWAAIVVVAAGLAAWGWFRPEAPRLETRFTFGLPSGQVLMGNGVAISPDGRTIVVTGSESGRTMLFRRTVDQLETVPIRGTEGGQFPFFSPNGEWLGFFTESALKKVPSGGGPASTIAPAGSRFGASWGPDETIVFASSASADLMRVSAAGGKPEVLVAGKSFNGALRWPVFSEDGRAVFFTVFSGGLASTRVAVHSLDTRQSHVVVEGTYPIVLSKDTLLFARAGSLWSARLDPSALTIGNTPPNPIVEGVQINAGGLALVSAVKTGTIAFRPGVAGDVLRLVWATLEGVQQPLTTKPDTYRSPRLSPDGKRVAFSIVSSGGASEGDSSVWVYDTETMTTSRVTFGSGRYTDPIWTPDGLRIIYASSETVATVRNLYSTFADGTGTPEQLTKSGDDQIPRTISRDGRTVVFQQRSPAGNWDLVALSMEGDRKATPFIATASNESLPALSPNDRFVAYMSDETGRNEVFVRAFPGPVGKWQVSGTGGTDPVWAPNGRELYYYSLETGGIVAVPVDISGATFSRRGVPRNLFTHQRPFGFPLTITPAGDRFVLLDRGAGEEVPEVVVTLNAFGRE